MTSESVRKQIDEDRAAVLLGLTQKTKSNLLQPCLYLTPPVPGLHPPDEPGAFLFQDLVPLNQTQQPIIPADQELRSTFQHDKRNLKRDHAGQRTFQTGRTSHLTVVTVIRA